jgi:hypothetical protein
MNVQMSHERKLSNSNDPISTSPPSSSPPPEKFAVIPLDSEDFINIAYLKSFLHKKFQSASSLIKKSKTHTCKVNVVTPEECLQLVVSDGTFMNEVLQGNIYT